MKFVALFLTALTLTALAAEAKKAPPYEGCRTDGCDIRRGDQVDAVLQFLTSEQNETDCNSLVSSMLELKRVGEDEFALICGESPTDKSATYLQLEMNDDLTYKVIVRDHK